MRAVFLLPLYLTLGLAACGPTDETLDATILAPHDGVKTKVYEEGTPDEYHLVVRDTRKQGGTYVERAEMDARARAWCDKRGMGMAIVSRGQSYMKNDLTTDLWFSCMPVAPTIAAPKPEPQPTIAD